MTPHRSTLAELIALREQTLKEMGKLVQSRTNVSYKRFLRIAHLREKAVVLFCKTPPRSFTHLCCQHPNVHIIHVQAAQRVPV